MLVYRELSRHLGADQPFYGLQSFGLDGEPLVENKDEADCLVTSLKDVVKPFGAWRGSRLTCGFVCCISRPECPGSA